MSKNTKTLYILLMRFPGGGPMFMELMTGFYYTHASIGLGEDMNTFYSFVKTGFIAEDINRYVNKQGREPFPCRLYRLQVPAASYQAVKRVLGLFIRFQALLHYTNMGLILNLFSLPYRRKFGYYCSHFVAEVLNRSKAVKLKKRSCRYMPQDIILLPGMELLYQGDLRDMRDHYHIQPLPKEEQFQHAHTVLRRMQTPVPQRQFVPIVPVHK